MIKDITIGQYIEGNSLIHRTDPRTKIMLTMVFMILVLMVKSIVGIMFLCVITILIIKFSNLPIKMIIKGFRSVIFISLFAGVINIFTYDSPYIFEYNFVHISYYGILVSIKMVLKFVILIAGTSILTYTTTPILLTDGLELILKPLGRIGLPTHDIAMMMTIAMRFIPTILEETQKIIKAQASRGADLDSGNLWIRTKSYIPILVPLFIGVLRRADELAIAMEARCYQGGNGRTRMKQLKLGMDDLKVSVIMIIVIVILLLI